MAESIVTNEDCMLMMSRYPDNHFELAIVDPPYGIGQGGKKQNSRSVNKDGSLIKKYDRRNGSQIVVKPKNYHDNYKDEKPPDREYFKELFRVSKNQIIWGANHFGNLAPSPAWIVWDKVNGDTDQSDCELAWTNFKTAVRQIEFMWNGFTQGISFTQGRINQGNKALCEERMHPNQKPIELYKWIYKNYANVGDKILDTHLGGGSSRIAADIAGFDFYGCELDKDYFEAQEKRFRQHKAQTVIQF